MKRKSFSRVLVANLLAGGVLLVFAGIPAEAKIRCHGPFQVIRGAGQHATPWCEDNYLARIARSYGWRVSNRAVRQNPELKARICRQIGHDSRLIQICSDHRPDGDHDINGY